MSLTTGAGWSVETWTAARTRSAYSASVTRPRVQTVSVRDLRGRDARKRRVCVTVRVAARSVFVQAYGYLPCACPSCRLRLERLSSAGPAVPNQPPGCVSALKVHFPRARVLRYTSVIYNRALGSQRWGNQPTLSEAALRPAPALSSLRLPSENCAVLVAGFRELFPLAPLRLPAAQVTVLLTPF